MSPLNQPEVKEDSRKTKDENKGVLHNFFECKKLPSNPARRPLKEIQPSSADHLRQPKLITKINVEKAQPKSDDSERLRRMLCSDEVNDDFWKERAEQTRSALVEACQENKKLHQENEALNKKLCDLEKELSGLVEYKLLYKIHCLESSVQ